MRMHPSLPRRQQGMTLVEMMVAITIGMIIVAAMAVLFANNSRARGETDKAAQKIENGRFALETLGSELQHAGYFVTVDPRPIGTTGGTATVSIPASLPDPCTTSSDVAALRAAISLHVQGYNNYSSGISCISDVKSATDVVFIRRVATCAQGATGCTTVSGDAPVFQPAGCSSTTQLSGTTYPDIAFNLDKASATTGLTRTLRDCTTAAPTYALVHRFYFIAANDRSGDGIPTLKRADLGASGFTTTSLVQGVENMQIEYGIDTNDDGNADVYTPSPAVYFDCPATNAESVCMGHWSNVVAVKLHLLVRNLESSSNHADSKKYVLGLKATKQGVASEAEEIAATSDGYKRSVFSEVVRLQNPSTRKFNPV